MSLCGAGRSQEASLVRVEQSASGQWLLRRNGKPTFIKGVCGAEHLALLKELGGNSLRTYGVDQLEKKDAAGKNLLDQASDLGLTVALGVGVKPVRFGLKVDDPVQMAEQRDKVLAAVRRYKNHPALLLWSIGNEVELQRKPEEFPQIFAALNELALLVKKEDPNHPVMTVIAGPSAAKIKAVLENYPALDILGVNAYREAASMPQKLQAAGWKKPYVLTEFGPRGSWEVPKTPWLAPIEPTTLEKAALYQKSYEANARDFSAQCLGSYAFKWGDKQEVTPTWMSMFLPSGEKTPAVDVASHCWTGQWPENRAPSVESVTSDLAGKTVEPGSEHVIRFEAKDPEHDPLTSEAWVMRESDKPKIGGDKEAVPDVVPGCTVAGDSPMTYTLRAPNEAGNYRLFLKVVDDHGGASTENIPFQVR